MSLMMITQSSATPIWNLIHDTLQYNVAGIPLLHEHTEWDFDPEQGKARRAQYEALNGPRGRDLIARLGTGMNFDGPWGVKVAKAKPDLRYNP
ncbi:uncharacterized protein [Chelonus insularis]|nr:uncharacterized protein LOC118074360 isoform X2 [Chelonus insularis]XP_034951403.1 uncharacterized protein LOC118074360 isoform X2 [Chelonus insularis]